MRLQRNGIKDVVSVLWWVALFVLLLGVIAFFVIARGGLGAGWGVGWRGWMLIPILLGVLYVVIGLLVLAGVLFFLARIKDNLATTRAAQEAAASARAAKLAAAAEAAAASVAETVVEPEQPPVAAKTARAGIATIQRESKSTQPQEGGRLPGVEEAARIAAEMAAIEASTGQASPARVEASTPTVSASSSSSAGAGSQVDLTVIEGIGPVYAQRLREAGITTFAELAEADDELLERITDGNLERVVRDDWRGQARRLSA